jgi:flagellar hook-length control protein FliK
MANSSAAKDNTRFPPLYSLENGAFDMNLTGINESRLVLTPSATTALARSWAVGQILDARVVAHDAAAQTATLRIGSVTVEARSELPLPVGETIRLQVVASGQTVVLRPAILPDEQTTVLQQAWRQSLPRQTEIAPLVNQLLQLSQAATSPSPSLPAPLAALVKQIANVVPQVNTLVTPEGVKRALADSGITLEAKLARPDASPASDFKAALLQLRSRLVEAPLPGVPAAELLAKTDGALARIQLHQLASIPTETVPVPLFAEIPLRDGDRADVLRLAIEPQAQGQERPDAPRAWTVWLSLSPGDLGPVHCRITVQGESAAVSFWAERADTARLFQERLGELEAGLADDGFTAGRLHAQAGIPPNLPAPHPPRGILNERA